jgi:hypothetical protein
MKHARIGRLLWLALVIVTVVARVSAQDKNAKPDFNGTWKIDVPATAKANGTAAQPGTPLTLRVATEGASNVPQTVTLVQTAENLTIKIQGRPDVVYILDNKQKKGEITTRGGKVEITIRAKWDGAKIVNTTTEKRMDEGQLVEVEYQETRSIDKEGRLNFALSTSTGRGNYKAVYVKDAPAP